MLPAFKQNQFLYIIDILAPFALSQLTASRQVINWSKTPFLLLERNGIIPDAWCDQIMHRFTTYCQKIAALGFNAISIDDLAHLTSHSSYPEYLQIKIEKYKSLFENLFAIAANNNLEIFVNTDASFAPAGLLITPKMAIDSMVLFCDDLFTRYPYVKGLILRLGECDGVDVKGEIRSNLTFQKAVHARSLICELLKVFEHHKRVLIVRTWTVGAFEIGDLIWNVKTYDKVFDGLSSSSLIVSHKYGESDFYRYLELNPLIFYGEQRKIIEFQTRREYEGFGEFPSFIGYDYERYRDQLMTCQQLVGIHVWCQTGGWSHFHRPTFLAGSSLWNEINTEITIKLFSKNNTTEEALIDFSLKRFPGRDPSLLIRLMKLSDEVIKGLWYLPEFSGKVLFFRRLRIPPLLWVFWDTFVVNSFLKIILRQFITDHQKTIDDAFNLLPKIIIMKQYATELGIDSKDFDFQYATFELLAKVRKFLLSSYSSDINDDLHKTIKNYTERFPNGFIVSTSLSKDLRGKRVLGKSFQIILRQHSSYRRLEIAAFELCLFVIRPIIRLWGRKRIPKFASERAMGIEMLLK